MDIFRLLASSYTGHVGGEESSDKKRTVEFEKKKMQKMPMQNSERRKVSVSN